MPVAATLSTIPLFSQLRESDLARLSQAVQQRSFPKNSVILFQDDPGAALYIVERGQVKVVITAEDGREVILSIRSKGDFFGEMSLIDDEPRSAHVIAVEDSEIMILRREDFKMCLQEIPQIAAGLLRALCKRLRQADNKISSLVLQDVPSRVAGLLLQLADENDGENITQRLTHHMIAQMIGSSRETVSRTMRDLTSKGIIQTGRKTIRISDRRDTPTHGLSGRLDSEVVEVSRRTITILNRQALEDAAGQV
ncbi:MAG: Crp/Fnr family transcriptional regulator [Gemmatimonadales bacterium]